MLLTPNEISHETFAAATRSRRLSEATTTSGTAIASDLPGNLSLSLNHRRDSEELIDRVRSSLWGLLDAPQVSGPAELEPDEQDRLRSTALQGAIALEQLQTNMAQEVAAREQLEREIRQARHALTKMHAELVGTRAEERQARFLATHDPLTGLSNRAHFHDHLTQALSANAALPQGVVVMYIDLDDFKPVNDTYGHAAGDVLLRIVARRLTRVLRAQDLVSRLGGDEFACLLTGIEPGEQVNRLAVKLRESVRAPCKIGAHLVRVDASIGIAFHGAGEAEAADLLLKADMAMYRAKHDGVGIAFFDDSPHD
ncbi:MAG: GGDEF domain-containing protein [Burkholderiaceae bacterium]